MIITILIVILYYLIGIFSMIQVVKVHDNLEVEQFDDDEWKAVFIVAIGWPIVVPITTFHYMQRRGFFKFLTKKRKLKITKKVPLNEEAELVMSAIQNLDEEDQDALRRMGVIE